MWQSQEQQQVRNYADPQLQQQGGFHPQQQQPYPQQAPYPQQQAPYPPQQALYPPQQAPYPQQQAPYPPQQQVVYIPNQQQQYHQPPQAPGQNPYNPQTTQPVGMSQPGWTDPEDPEAKGFEFNDQSVRKGFIRKVFSILSIQLILTAGIIAIFVFHQPTIDFVLRNVWLFWVSFAMLLVLMIVLVCCEGVRRKSPLNYFILFLFTGCMSFMLGVMSASFTLFEVLLAVGITAAVTIGLTIFALQTKWDFTTMGGILFVSVIILMIFGIFAMIFRSQIIVLVYASLGALLFCFYLVYDIQLMMGGKHKYSISPEEYIFASLNLYIDIVNIFMYILMIIGAARG